MKTLSQGKRAQKQVINVGHYLRVVYGSGSSQHSGFSTEQSALRLFLLSAFDGFAAYSIQISRFSYRWKCRLPRERSI
jgi:hypothetical protein